MKITLAMVGLFTALVVGGCGDDKDDGAGATADPVTACKSFVAEACSKFFGCYTDAELELAASSVGNNEADCRTKLEQMSCSAEMTKCDSGETYSSSKASECLSQYEAFSCSEFKMVDNLPAACDQVCQ